MKLKFDPSLDFQQDAIAAATDLFEGAAVRGILTDSKIIGSDLFTHGTMTQWFLDPEILLENTQKIQTKNGIEPVSDKIDSNHFSIEMETGTGKTYVYLRTIFELNKRYGMTKFIIVVPSVAIREGVLASINDMRDHFASLYARVPFTSFIYDSKNLGTIKAFLDNQQIQIMVINIQSFQKDAGARPLEELSEDERKKLNIINREHEATGYFRPIQFIQHAHPLVIIDEPQSVVGTDAARRAIDNLNPMATLRYSATHKDYRNLLYRLSPIDAFDKGLVKQIEVASIMDENGFNDAYVKLLAVDNAKGLKAQLEFDKQTTGTNAKVKRHRQWVKSGQDLFSLSGGRQQYETGFILNEISCEAGVERVGFSGGTSLVLAEAVGALRDDIMRFQIETTIKEHLKKEQRFDGRDIKVLSLFFIDKVENYRTYDVSGNGSGKLATWFEEIYADLTSKPPHDKFADADVSNIHDGYFAKDSKGKFKNSAEGKGNKEDASTYALIMQDKKRLLDVNTPLRFIFSHSALREGWDNPNVFQICTLNETSSSMKKRQEIGRGLRLPVDSEGERIHDSSTNILTVIANESYDNFANSLQHEFKEDCGVDFGGRTRDNRKRYTVQLNKHVIADPAFVALWERIEPKTRYCVAIDTPTLIDQAAANINGMPPINAPRLTMTKTRIDIDKEGVEAGAEKGVDSSETTLSTPLPDLLFELQKITELTRSTLAQILLKSGRLGDFVVNPQSFITATKKAIHHALYVLLLDGIEYKRLENGDVWEMRLIEEEAAQGIVRYLSNLYEVTNSEKCLYDRVEHESDVEARFAQDLDNNEDIKIFTKLPRWFTIDTPLGPYNPDWAFVTNDKQLYFVCETKGSVDRDDLRRREGAKIFCAKKHFDELGVEYKTTTNLKDVLIAQKS